MKINCDVCNRDEASVFCSADDAALCSACDQRVHHANILAGKHLRFSLILPSPKDSPICDICQEKKALLFCQQDRAILCKECDVNIHKVNEHKMNHCRFLLTGVKLSPAALSATTGTAVVHEENPKSRDQQPVPIRKPVAATPQIVNQACGKTQKITTAPAPEYSLKTNGSGHGSATASSISEYLIETLPGWHVEDFLDSPPTFSKVCDDDPAMFWDDELLKGSMNDCISPETMGIWVPQAPPPAAPPPLPPPPPQPPQFHTSFQFQPYSILGKGNQIINGSSISFGQSNNMNKITKSSGKRRSDDGNCFTVPQIIPPTTTMTGFKRSRTIR